MEGPGSSFLAPVVPGKLVRPPAHLLLPQRDGVPAAQVPQQGAPEVALPELGEQEELQLAEGAVSACHRMPMRMLSTQVKAAVSKKNCRQSSLMKLDRHTKCIRSYAKDSIFSFNTNTRPTRD